MEKTKNVFGFSVEKNAFKDMGDGRIEFNGGLTITDETIQRNGTKYDIKSMDLSEYKGQLTADHSMSITEVIGKVIGVRKVANRRVVVDAIQFAINESALALFTYNMMRAGYLTDFSIETFGPYPSNEDDTYYNSTLIGLSVVVVGNNRSANIKNEVAQIVKNSIDEAKERHLDPSIVENNYLCYDIQEIKPDQNSIITNNEGNTMTEEVKTPVTPETETEKTPDVAEMVKNAIDAAIKPLQNKLSEIEQNAFDKQAKEPEMTAATKATNAVSELKSMDYRLRHGEQIVAAKQWLKGGSQAAKEKLYTINELHKEMLVAEGLVSNSIDTIDFGNFVISPELYSEIQGHRSSYDSLLSRVQFQETLSTKFGWLKRSGDIDMTAVKFLSDANNGNLKPVSSYTADYSEKDMEELAAVTPVMNATNRFLAADLLGDIAQGYRTDYDRKRAQLVIARLQQATDTTGNQTAYTVTSAITSLQSWVTVWSSIMEEVPNGVFVMSYKTKGELVKQALASGIDPVAAMALNRGEFETVLGAPGIVVPNDLLPALGAGDTKTFVVDGSNVTINQAVFYADLSMFKGRVSGGLTYDLSTEAAYEQGGVVKSAFQRNELVLRGSFFRNGAFLDDDFVASLFAGNAS